MRKRYNIFLGFFHGLILTTVSFDKRPRSRYTTLLSGNWEGSKAMWYQQVSENIEVSVRPLYCRTDSSPKENLYVWTYDVVIRNHGSEAVQLLNRFWRIVDAANQTQEVHGPGVIGERPIIEPGSEYTYTSFTHLPTSRGKMAGHYEMISLEGRTFKVGIPEFSLQLPVRLVSGPGEFGTRTSPH